MQTICLFELIKEEFACIGYLLYQQVSVWGVLFTVWNKQKSLLKKKYGDALKQALLSLLPLLGGVGLTISVLVLLVFGKI
jgi:hypothetical protein